MDRVVEWYGVREEDAMDGPSDDYYDVDPDEEEREIEARLTAYENWLGRT